MCRAMSDSVYRKTPLPVRLNLKDRNTKSQLSTGAEEKANGRGALEGVGLASSASQSQKNCTDVMHKDLRDWLDNNGMKGPPPSGEAEQRAMWTWMRDFHKEYNDDWFARNMPRLHEKFRPVFMEEMKKMRAETAAAAQKEAAEKAASSPPPPQNDLLDFDAPAAASPPAAPTNGVADLLDVGIAEPAAPVTASPVAASPPAQAPAPVATDALLDLDFGSPAPPVAAAAPAPAAAYAPAATVAAPLAPSKGGAGGDLLDLMF